MSDSKSSSASFGFPSLLTILFIGLKLGGVISWSWWWVLSPIWISFVVNFLLAFIIYLATDR